MSDSQTLQSTPLIDKDLNAELAKIKRAAAKAAQKKKALEAKCVEQEERRRWEEEKRLRQEEIRREEERKRAEEEERQVEEERRVWEEAEQVVARAKRKGKQREEGLASPEDQPVKKKGRGTNELGAPQGSSSWPTTEVTEASDKEEVVEHMKMGGSRACFQCRKKGLWCQPQKAKGKMVCKACASAKVQCTMTDPGMKKCKTGMAEVGTEGGECSMGSLAELMEEVRGVWTDLQALLAKQSELVGSVGDIVDAMRSSSGLLQILAGSRDLILKKRAEVVGELPAEIPGKQSEEEQSGTEEESAGSGKEGMEAGE